MTTSAPTLPHWDMSVVYPSLQSPEFEQALRAFVDDIAALAALFERHGVAKQERAPLTDETVQAFEQVVQRYNAVLAQAVTLRSYIQGFVSTDSRDDYAQARRSEFQQHSVRLAQLGIRFTAWIGSLDVEALTGRSAVARDHAFVLRKAQLQAAHQMAPAEEDLAAELNLTGGSAWANLYRTVTSQLTVPFERAGTVVDLPISELRNLAYEADRAVRRRAYEAELATWRRAAVPLAAAINSIKGEVNALARRRGWATPLDTALFDNQVDRATLDAMMAAARASFPDFRRYLRAKARLLGLPALAWYDLYAPVGAVAPQWSYDQAAQFIVAQFGAYSARLSDFAARAFRERWIDAEPRAGKEDGGFCMPLRRDESRILVNYTPAVDGLSTIAHELGHAYHNLNLAGRTMLQRATPSTLAETASIFCESMISRAALGQADASAQVALLDASLQSMGMTVVDISSRYLFEQQVFERRLQHELSVDDLNAAMLESQRATYGDGLDETQLHPYMWAAKPHYYNSQRSFYNFPYMFGLLFGLGLYARYRADPESFKAGYDELLSSTGLADAATLAARFGIDLRAVEFWQSSLDVVRADIDRFEHLAAQPTN